MTRMSTGNETMAGLSSLLIHCSAVALILMLGTLKPVQQLVKQSVTLIAPVLKPYQNQPSGGGGNRSLLEASKGKAPKSAPKQFTPPMQATDPKLPMTPTIIGDAPSVSATNYGDPLGALGPASNGPGSSGGIGSGIGTGVGASRGAGFAGGVYRIGGGVSQPSILRKVEPEYSEEARKAKWQGMVTLAVIVDETGHARDIKVAQSLGLGLDQKAIEAVEKWLFKPGMKDGRPVPVYATIQVSFHLL